VAVHTEPDALLIDEVLSVGDMGFQGKSVQQMQALVRDGTAVVFVSHSMYYVAYFCHRVILLDQGQVGQSGEPRQVVNAYQNLMQRGAQIVSRRGPDADPLPSSGVRIVDVGIQDSTAQPRQEFAVGETLVLSIKVHTSQLLDSPVIGFSIHSAEGVLCYGAHNQMDEICLPSAHGDFEVRVLFPDLRLLPGSYLVSVGVLERSAIGVLDRADMTHGFRVQHTRAGLENGLFLLPHRWTFVEGNQCISAS
jgi:hypothetical protein